MGNSSERIIQVFFKTYMQGQSCKALTKLRELSFLAKWIGKPHNTFHFLFLNTYSRPWLALDEKDRCPLSKQPLPCVCFRETGILNTVVKNQNAIASNHKAEYNTFVANVYEAGWCQYTTEEKCMNYVIKRILSSKYRNQFCLARMQIPLRL